MSRDLIKTRSHPSVLRLKQVRDGKNKSLVFCEGWKVFEDLLNSSLIPVEIFCVEPMKETVQKWLSGKGKLHLPVRLLKSDVMGYVSDLESAPGVIALAKRPSFSQTASEGECGSPLYVIAHRVNNPQNLGNIVRTCEAASVSRLFVTRLSADIFSSKTVRGSTGSVFRLPHESLVELPQVIEKLKKRAIPIYAAHQNGTMDYDQVDWSRPAALALGAEATGFTKSELELFDAAIRIPMGGEVESLNVGTAAAICLFESVRQRRAKGVSKFS